MNGAMQPSKRGLIVRSTATGGAEGCDKVHQQPVWGVCWQPSPCVALTAYTPVVMDLLAGPGRVKQRANHLGAELVGPVSGQRWHGGPFSLLLNGLLGFKIQLLAFSACLRRFLMWRCFRSQLSAGNWPDRGRSYSAQ